MKIAVYKDNLSTGRGADRAVKNFAAGLAERGLEVSLMEKAEFFARVLNRPAAASGDTRDAFDIIVATGPNEIVDMDLAGYFARPSRARVVLQLHLAPRGFFKWRHPLRNCRIRRAFNKADAAQVLCSSYEAEFRRLAPHPRLFTIGNYTDTPTRPSGPQGPQNIILYPAAVVNRVKNQKLLIAAFAHVADAFPSWRVRLLGKTTTPYAAACRRLVEKRGLAGRVEFSGFIDDLASAYGQAAFVAFPSTLEGFPLALLDAAQFGLCAIAHKALPGADDIIRDGQTGLLTAPSEKAYAEGLRQLMSNVELRRKLGENARAFCADQYSRERIFDQWEALLGRTAAEAPSETTSEGSQK